MVSCTSLMANTKSAEKALRQSKKRAQENLMWKEKIKALIKTMKTERTEPAILKEQYNKLQSLLDKAAKNHVMHKNKAARIKSRIVKIIETAHDKSDKLKQSKKRGSKSNKS